MVKRKIIKIDEEKCNGCGLCIPNCPEGALQLIDGKARLISDIFCDGLGACIGHCPQDAIITEEREAEEYDEKKTMVNIVKAGKNTIIAHLNHLKDHGEEEYLKQAYEYLKEKGIEIERKAAEYFKLGKYGKSFAAILDLIWTSKIARGIAKFFTRLVGKKIMGKIEYPNDFLNEIRADREMNFKDRLGEIKVPTLVMCGELDIGYTADDVRTTAEGIPNAELILYKGYGHNLIMRNRKQVQEDVLKFLNNN